MLNLNELNVDFVLKKYYDWGKKFVLRSLVNFFFNNKQKNGNDSVRKEQMKDFKKGKGNRNHENSQLYRGVVRTNKTSKM